MRSRELVAGTEILGRVALPRPYPPADPAVLAALTEQISSMDRVRPRMIGGDALPDPAGNEAAGCPDLERHVAAARRARRIERELGRQRHQHAHQGEGLVAELRRVLDLLGGRGYVDGWSLTERGEILRFVYSELDLLVVEVLQRGCFDRLAPPELAAFVSAFVFEPRSEEAPSSWPTPDLEDAGSELLEVWSDLVEDEVARELPETRPPEAGFATLAYHWARGLELDELLDEGDMAPGDFVRTSRQLLDLLRQLRDAVPALEPATSAAITAVDRGVVAAGGIG